MHYFAYCITSFLGACAYMRNNAFFGEHFFAQMFRIQAHAPKFRIQAQVRLYVKPMTDDPVIGPHLTRLSVTSMQDLSCQFDFVYRQLIHDSIFQHFCGSKKVYREFQQTCVYQYAYQYVLLYWSSVSLHFIIFLAKCAFCKVFYTPICQRLSENGIEVHSALIFAFFARSCTRTRYVAETPKNN